MQISLIVVTYNSVALLPAFFAALEAHSPQAELVVVDNGSHDGTPQYVARMHPRARLLANPENVGFGRACNQGAALAGGEALVFLNPDVTVTPGWLEHLSAHLVEQPGVAVIAPETLYPGHLPMPAAPGPALEAVAAVPGSALMIRRSAWLQLGGFDQRICMYWEDTELCWRAWLLGWQVVVDHSTHVFHERGASGGGRAWAAEAARNGLYVHLKLAGWRRIAGYAARLLVKTALAGRGQRAGLRLAWHDNARRLGDTLAQRRALRRAARIEPRRLEGLIDAHTRRQRAERRIRPMP
jgi:GT2 family glycosyltransferase